MWQTIDKFKEGDTVMLLHCDNSTSIAEIKKGFVSYTVKIIEGTEKGREYDVFSSHEAKLIKSS